MIYKKRPLKVDAERWYGVEYDRKAGENTQPIYHLDVDYFRDPLVESETPCEYCERAMGDHGWIDTLDGGHTVCPGDWIVTEVGGRKVPFKPHEFEIFHEPNLDHSLSALRNDVEEAAVALIERVGAGVKFTPAEGDEEIIRPSSVIGFAE